MTATLVPTAAIEPIWASSRGANAHSAVQIRKASVIVQLLTRLTACAKVA